MDVGPMLEVDQAATGERISIEDFRKIPPDDRQKMVTEIHKRMLQDALKAGHLEKYLPEYLQKGCAPSSLALVYMERWEYFTPPELRASAPLSNEVILVVTDPQNVIRKCREFSFDPNSEAAKFWKDTAPEFPLPPTGVRLYAETANELSELKIEPDHVTVIIFARGAASMATVRLPESMLAHVARVVIPSVPAPETEAISGSASAVLDNQGATG